MHNETQHRRGGEANTDWKYWVSKSWVWDVRFVEVNVWRWRCHWCLLEGGRGRIRAAHGCENEILNVLANVKGDDYFDA